MTTLKGAAWLSLYAASSVWGWAGGTDRPCDLRDCINSQPRSQDIVMFRPTSLSNNHQRSAVGRIAQRCPTRTEQHRTAPIRQYGIINSASHMDVLSKSNPTAVSRYNLLHVCLTSYSLSTQIGLPTF